MQIVSNGDNLQEMPKTRPRENLEKYLKMSTEIFTQIAKH